MPGDSVATASPCEGKLNGKGRENEVTLNLQSQGLSEHSTDSSGANIETQVYLF